MCITEIGFSYFFRDIQYLGAWLIGWYAFVWVIGWIVRGFMGIPFGKDIKSSE
jgi:hypothetical protein